MIKKIVDHLGFKTQLILLTTTVLFLSVLLLTLFSLKLISESMALWTIHGVEETLERVLSRAHSADLRRDAEEALHEYRQLKALQPPIKKAIIKFAILLATTAFIISSILIYLFIHHLTKPLMKLTLATKSVSEGRLDEDIKIPRAPREVSRLVDAFNQMCDSLRRAQSELRRAERVATWRDVAQVLAHEIKNPLTPIQLSIERIRKRYGSPSFEKTLFDDSEVILREIEGLKKLTREFSDFARPPQLNLRLEDVNGIVDGCISTYAEAAKGVEFQVEYGEVPPVLVDKEALRRVIINLIINGIEAMPNGGVLGIRTGKEERSIFIEVSDTGVGISKEDLPHLFVPHFSRKKEGFGLGLAISHDIIEAHQGKIEVRGSEGKGCVFKIILPMSQETKEEGKR